MMIEEWINRAILIVLAISTLIQVLNWLGFLPIGANLSNKTKKISKRLKIFLYFSNIKG